MLLALSVPPTAAHPHYWREWRLMPDPWGGRLLLRVHCAGHDEWANAVVGVVSETVMLVL